MTVNKNATTAHAARVALLDRQDTAENRRELIAAAMKGTGFSAAPDAERFFANTLAMEGSFPALDLPKGTVFETTDRQLHTPGDCYLLLAVYRIGRKVGFGIVHKRDEEGRTFVTHDGLTLANHDAWTILGAVLAVTFEDGSFVSSRGVRLSPEGAPMRSERAEAFGLSTEASK